MSRPIVCAFCDTSAEMLSKIMASYNIGAVPISEQGRLVGIVTDRDLVTRVLASGKSAELTSAGDIMSSPAVCISPEHSVTEAARLMSHRKLRRLPVCENGMLAGMLSLSDISNSRRFFAETAAAFCDICSI